MKVDPVSIEAALENLRAHSRSMPPVVAMAFDVVGYDGERLRMQAPLAPNVNDKGTAFGGSMTSLMTLAGWGLVTLRLQQAGLVADVFVADSHVHYRKPLYADLVADAMLAPGETWEPFLATFMQRGRARIELQARILLPEGGIAAELAGRYVAIAKG
jgi:thioesterase domain-containing protein